MLFRWSRVLLGDKRKHQCGVVWDAASSEAGGAVYTSHGKHSCRSTRASRMSGAFIGGCGECFWASACSGAHQRRVSGCHQNCGRPSANDHGDARKVWLHGRWSGLHAPNCGATRGSPSSDGDKKALLALSVSRAKFTCPRLVCATHCVNATQCAGGLHR